MKVKLLSRVRLFATPCTVAYRSPLSMGFSRQEYWSGLPFPSPGDLPNPGIELGSLSLEADALTSEPPGKPSDTYMYICAVFSCSVMSSALWPQNCSPSGSSVDGLLQARMLEWVAMPFSRGSSQPRDWTQVSRIEDRFFTIWTTREAHIYIYINTLSSLSWLIHMRIL